MCDVGRVAVTDCFKLEVFFTFIQHIVKIHKCCSLHKMISCPKFDYMFARRLILILNFCLLFYDFPAHPFSAVPDLLNAMDFFRYERADSLFS